MKDSVLNQMSTMKLHGMLNAYRAILQTNQHHQLTNDELVNILIQAEYEERENRKTTRYLKAAKFRYQSSIEELDFTAQRGLDKNLVFRLADGSFIKNGQNVLITGPTGVGKSHLASALGNQACLLGYRTLYYNVQKLFPMLKMSKADGSYLKLIDRIERHDLLILDDFGLKVLDNNDRLMLMEIIEDRHGRKATVIASQLPVAKWYDIIGESTVADAILDRTIHSAHRIELTGKSLRKSRTEK